jgi:hypothetical protein
MQILGSAEIKWSENKNVFENEQIFIKTGTFFFGSEDSSAIEVTSGLHSYKFACRVPQTAPSSVEGKFGKISYIVKVNLEILDMPPLTCEKKFFVKRIEDLNIYPELKIANEIEEEKIFGCFAYKSAPVLIKLTIPASGFVMSQEVPVGVEIFNRSNKTFDKSVISLNRVETYNSNKPIEKKKIHVVPLIAIVSERVKKNSNEKFTTTIQIPIDAAVSNDRGVCDIFQVTYEIKFIMKASKWFSFSVSVPIYIGSIGFRLDSAKSIYDAVSQPVNEEYRKSRKKIKYASIKSLSFSAPFCNTKGTYNNQFAEKYGFFM